MNLLTCTCIHIECNISSNSVQLCSVWLYDNTLVLWPCVVTCGGHVGLFMRLVTAGRHGCFNLKTMTWSTLFLLHHTQAPITHKIFAVEPWYKIFPTPYEKVSLLVIDSSFVSVYTKVVKTCVNFYGAYIFYTIHLYIFNAWQIISLSRSRSSLCTLVNVTTLLQ